MKGMVKNMKNKFLVLIIMLFSFVTIVNAQEISHKDVPEDAVIIGNHMFSSEFDYTNSGVYNGSITSQVVMMGSSSLDTSAYDSNSDFVIYRKAFNEDPEDPETYPEEWINSLTGADIPLSQIPETFKILFINGTCVDPLCYTGEEGNVNVSFNSQYDGTFERTIKYNSILLASNLPELSDRAGYKFTCWIKQGENDCFDLTSKITENITLVDAWEAITYHVTYDTNGGSATGIPASVTCNINDDNCITPDAIPEKDGYSFAGWSIGGNENGLIDSNSSMVPILGLDTDITLTAVWKLMTYDLTYFLDGGSVDPSLLVRTIDADHNTVELPYPTRVGYDFKGWVGLGSTLGGVTIDVNVATVHTLEPITFTAQWDPITYRVSFDLDGGKINDSTTVDQSTCTYETECHVPSEVPVKTGYEFINWIDDVNHYVYNSGDVISNITSNMSLKAQYVDEHLLSINYNLNGGTFNGNPNITFSKGTAPMLSSPTKVGYTFDCWLNGSSCVSARQRFDTSISVVAKWNPIDFKVSYQLNGGSVANANNFEAGTYKYDVGTTIPTEVPILADHTFHGWESSDGYIYNAGDTVINKTTDVVLTAKFDLKEKRTISYILDGGTFAGEVITSYGDNASFELPSPTKVGYEFTGWKSGNKIYAPRTNISTINKQNLTITAQWEPISFTVSYNTNGSDVAVPNTTGCTFADCTITPIEPELEGKTFEGWYYEGYLFKNGGRTSLAGIPVENNSTIVLTARWSNKERYFISYLLAGGEFEATPINSFYAGDFGSLATPTKVGYNFTGWKLSGTDTIVTDLSELTGDSVLEAQWDEKKFDIIYDKNSEAATFAGSNATGCQYSTGCVVTDIEPQWAGHEFKGWRANGVDYVAGDVIKEKEANVTLVAQWEDITYNVTFNVPNDATMPDNAITSLNYGTNELPIPTRVGWNFTGWKDQNDVVYPVVGDQVVAENISSDMTFTAQWVEKQFTIHFVIDPNESNDTLVDVTKNYFETYTIDANAMGINNIDETKVLEAWLLDGVEYHLNDTITEKEGTVNLTAKWSNRVSHTITYHTNGGVLPANAINSFYEGLSFTLPEPTRVGFTFGGWSDGTTTYNAGDPLTMSNDLEVEALWTAIDYEITYDYDGGEGTNVTTYNIANGNTITLVDPVLQDYVLDYWEIVSPSEGVTVEGNLVTVTVPGNITIKAHWVKDVYSITYDLGDGTLPTGEENPSSYSFRNNSVFELVAPVPDDSSKEFAGWLVANPSEGVSVSENTVTVTTPSNIELRAAYRNSSTGPVDPGA